MAADGAPRDQWSGKLGFVLAAAGSAVGLGNLWKFPYITWLNRGGAFVLIYLGCILAIGVPVMVSEIMVGRAAQKSPAAAFAALGKPRWSFVGWLGVVASIVILSFYTVIAGWSVRSFAQCLRWSLEGYQAPGEGAFVAFLAEGPSQIGLGLAFLGATTVIVVRGISGGIERATRILMPTLLAIMLYLLVTSTGMAGFGDALRFLFRPDFSAIEPHGVLEALGHAFFTLSLGMGAMITYGSYLEREESIVSISFTVALLDTLIALIACVIMFSIIFSVPDLQATMATDDAKSTVGMLFVTLPRLFYTEMAAGAVMAPLFYLLVAFAALSSTISLLEVTVASAMDRLGWGRVKATAVAGAVVGFLSIGSALSLGASARLSSLQLFGPFERLNEVVTARKPGVLAIFDHLSANWLLPLSGLFITLFVGWALEPERAFDEMFPSHRVPPLFFQIWRALVRYVCPVAIGWILFEVIRGGDFS